MATKRCFPKSRNLSIAWATAFLQVLEPRVRELVPLIITIRDFKDGVPQENAAIRQLLDEALRARGRPDSHGVANTIFPESLWMPSRPDARDRLFTRYEHIWKRIRRHPGNRRGVYFRRLSAYQPAGSDVVVNQLRHIIDTYRAGNHRRSALQAAVFDPTRDHTNSRQQGFPCLQQVVFLPSKGRLSVMAFYAIQYLFDRAYGNLLGLCRLGNFMAHEMGLSLARVICVAAVAQRGRATKAELQKLQHALQGLVESARD